MTVVGRSTLGAAAIVLLAGLVALSTKGLIGAVVALACAVVVTLMVVLGPEKLGTGFVLLAMFTAPQNSIRPIPTADFVTFSDLFLLLGAGLLLPTLLQRRGRYPALFLVGAVGLSAMVLIAATIGPTPVARPPLRAPAAGRGRGAAAVLPGLAPAGPADRGPGVGLRLRPRGEHLLRRGGGAWRSTTGTTGSPRTSTSSASPP